MKRLAFFFFRSLILLTLLFANAEHVQAQLQEKIGPYRVELQTDPPMVPIGRARLHFKVLDAVGQPIPNARVRTLTRMPGMAMGEHEEIAMPDAPGHYSAPATFPMGGTYVVDLKISAAKGEATGAIELQTGQSTLSGGSSLNRWLLLFGLGLVALFIVWRMARTGQRLNPRALLQWQAIAGVAALLVMFFLARHAVNNWRRPGSLTPLEAQGMEMNMPAPVGSTAVELATVRLGAVQRTVRYTGQAAGYIEQEVYPRVTGNLLWMPLYAGDRVKRGQLIARLDRSQIEPQIAAQRASRAMAEQGANVARDEYQAALANVRQQEAHWRVRIAALAEARQQERRMRAQIGARLAQVAEARAAQRKARAGVGNRHGAVAEAASGEQRAQATLKEAATQLRGARGALAEAQSDLAVAREEKSNSEADFAAAQTLVPDAEAEVAASQAEVRTETQEIERLRALVTEGLVSKRDVERQVARVEAARSRLKQAGARVAQAEAGVRGAQSRIRRAEAAIRGAEAKASQADAAIEGAQARQEAARADITAARARVQQSRAEVEGAGADIGGASARVRQMQADVQAARNEAAAAAATVRQAQAELEEGLGAVRTARAQAAAVRGRIGQAQAGVAQAEANVAQSTTTAGYTEIRSLLDGVVTQRIVSPGTLVSPGQAILKIAQTNPIRLQANVTEADLKLLRVGSLVSVRDNGGHGKSISARLTSVAPSVDAQTRTGIVEAIVANADGRFRPGEYVVMEITTGHSTSALSVPSAAVQQRAAVAMGEQPMSYVWVANAAANGQWTVHPTAVQTGVSNGTQVEIRSGLKPGQRVVTAGYQYLSEGNTVTTDQSTLMPTAPVSNASNTPRSAVITVSDKGFEPVSVTVHKDVPISITFTRKTEATCATEVVLPEFNIRRKLPINTPVTVEFTPRKAGTLAFGCGMDMMLRGQVVVRP